MDVERVGWFAAVAVSLAVAVVALLAGYTGYALLGIAVAACASINLL